MCAVVEPHGGTTVASGPGMESYFKNVHRLLEDVRALRDLPCVTIDLAGPCAYANNPYYAEMVRRFYRTTRRRHPRLWVVRDHTHGVALCHLDGGLQDYPSQVEASARRNARKAQRKGYRFDLLDYNAELEQVRVVAGSKAVRQGAMPEGYDRLQPHNNPASRSPLHDYRYFGVFREERLAAYGEVMIAGELAMVTHVLGHGDHMRDGVVPLTLLGMAERIAADHPQTRFLGYGTFFGAGPGLRRFKKKHGFIPHRVRWQWAGSLAHSSTVDRAA